MSNLNSSSNYKVQITLFFCVYPLVAVLSPAVGIISVMLCKPFFYRAMAYMNSLALFANIMAYVISEVAIDSLDNILPRLGYVWFLILAKLSIA